MGNLELVKQYEFIGKEFLTYLWYLSDKNNGKIVLNNENTIELWLFNSLYLDSEYGEVKSTVLKGDDPAISVEAKTSLAEGKKLVKGKFRLIIDTIEWNFTIDGKTLDISSVQIPRVSGYSQESILLYRLKAYEHFCKIIDEIFFKFIAIRIDENKWKKALSEIKKWIRG